MERVTNKEQAMAILRQVKLWDEFCFSHKKLSSAISFILRDYEKEQEYAKKNKC